MTRRAVLDLKPLPLFKYELVSSMTLSGIICQHCQSLKASRNIEHFYHFRLRWSGKEVGKHVTLISHCVCLINSDITEDRIMPVVMNTKLHC